MKKTLLFSLLALALAGFGFGEISIADTNEVNSDTKEVSTETTVTTTVEDANLTAVENKDVTTTVKEESVTETGNVTEDNKNLEEETVKEETTGEEETVKEETTGEEETVKEETTGEETSNEENAEESVKEKSEFELAYEFAFEKGITTMPSIEEADMEGGLTRIAMAKMLSQYAIKVLGLEPDETKTNKFNDVSEELDAQYNSGVTLAYQLGIMGINIPSNNFRPYDAVTRAEFATALSRMLYKTADGEDKYYSTHLKKLMDEKIITNDDPDMKELRGYVMIMLMRSAENATNNVDGEPTTNMANPASVYCVEQGGESKIVTDEEGNQSGICKLADGTEVDERDYYRENNKDTSNETGDVTPLYTEEELAAAEEVILNEGFGKMTVKTENHKITYMGDEKSTSELEYCKTFEEKAGITIDECVVFESEFYIPAQDAEMAGAFEPDTTLKGYQWYLGRTKGGEWKVLTFGY